MTFNPLRRSPIRKVSPKRSSGTTGGEYTFKHRGRSYSLPGRMLADPVSPDGWRWIATPHSDAVIRGIVSELADKRCEVKVAPNCWGWTADLGHAHHVAVKGMGGVHTDDRLFRCGERIRVLACPSCHRKLHGDVEWGLRRNAT